MRRAWPWIAGLAALAATGLGAWWWWTNESGSGGEDGPDPLDTSDADHGSNAVAPNASSGTLNGNAANAWAAFVAAHPDARCASAARDVSSQASAMAGRIVSGSNRQWIAQTYVRSTVRDACQSWVDSNPQATAQTDIAAGLEGVLSQYGADDLHQLSWHLAGQAFDVGLDSDSTKDSDLASLVAQHVANGGSAKFLQNEGGQSVRHVQFDDQVSTDFTLNLDGHYGPFKVW